MTVKTEGYVVYRMIGMLTTIGILRYKYVVSGAFTVNIRRVNL